MANELRLRRNNIAGSITDNPLTAGATTINSPGFVDLPTIDTTNHLILILDPLEANGAAEIVRVTAHTAASSVVTVVRGAETTSPRQHPLGTTWFHGPVTTDWNEVLTSSTRPAVPYTGEALYETDTLKNMRYSGTAWGQDGLLFDPPACRANRTTTQTIAHNTNSPIAFTAADTYDTANMHDTVTNNTRITVPIAGLYVCTGWLVWSATGTATVAAIRVNGVNWNDVRIDAGGGTTDQNVTDTLKLAANDIVELNAFQFSGVNKDVVNASLSVVWVGRGNNV